MAIPNEKLETFYVEIGHPGWQKTSDMFTWFDDKKDEHWIVIRDNVRCADWPQPQLLRVFGMPPNMPIIEVVRSGRQLGEKYKDFIICSLGVRGDRDDPTKGETGIRHRYYPPNGELILIHIWGALLVARNIETKLLMMWNTGSIRGNIKSLSGPGALTLPPPSWWSQLLNLDPFQPGAMKKLDSGLPLLNRELLDRVKSPGRPKKSTKITAKDSASVKERVKDELAERVLSRKPLERRFIARALGLKESTLARRLRPDTYSDYKRAAIKKHGSEN